MNRVLLGFLWRRHRLTTLLCGVAPVLIGVVVGFVYPTFSAQRAMVQAFRYSTKFFGQGQLDMLSVSGSFSMVFQHPFILLLYAVAPSIAPIGLIAG